MQKKNKFKDAWLSLSILAVLLFSVTSPASSNDAWLTKPGQNDSLTGQNFSSGSSPLSGGSALELTPVPSPTTSSESCASCDAFDMKVLSVTLTAISNNPNKTAAPSATNNLPSSLIYLGIVILIALMVLLIQRVILPKLSVRAGSEFQEPEPKQSNPVEKGKDNAE